MFLGLKTFFLRDLRQEKVDFTVNSAEDKVRVKGLIIHDCLPMVFPDHGYDRRENKDCRQVDKRLVHWRVRVEQTLDQGWGPDLSSQELGECLLPDRRLFRAGKEEVSIILRSKVADPAF